MAQTDKVRFMAFGDYGNGTGADSVAALVNAQAPDLVVTVGDNCYRASPGIAAQVGSKYQSWVTARSFFPALGNHEFSDACGGGTTAAGYKAYFTLPGNERYYDFVRGPVHFYVLNSVNEPDGVSAASAQASWLRSRLATSKSPWNIVYFHHSPYSSGGEHGSATWMRWPFEAWGASAVLTGHDHNYERILLDSNGDGKKMPYFVTGLGGESKYAFGPPVAGSVKRFNAEFGALLVTATSSYIDFKFLTTTGAVIDNYAMAHVVTRPERPDGFRSRVVRPSRQ